jgi:hypothetical protein
MSDELPTIAARVLMRAERIEDQIRSVPTNVGQPADMMEEEAREYAPLLLAYLRLAIAEGRRMGASPTPQNLSQVLISANNMILWATDNPRGEA